MLDTPVKGVTRAIEAIEKRAESIKPPPAIQTLSPIVEPIKPSSTVAVKPSKPIELPLEAPIENNTAEILNKINSLDLSPAATPEATEQPNKKSVRFSDQLSFQSTVTVNEDRDMEQSLESQVLDVPPHDFTTTATPQAINHSLIQSVIRDELDSFKVDIQSQLQNIHLELLRSFEVQKYEMQEMFEILLKSERERVANE
jgi:hypothetical protein